MDPAAPPPDPLAMDDLDDEDALQDDPQDDDDNYGNPQDDAPVAEPDPIEAALARGAAPREALRLICGALARQAALVEWIHLNPTAYSMSRQLDIARAVGRRQRVLSGLAHLILTEMRDGPDPDPPADVVDRLVGLLRDEVIKVLREVASPEQASAFEAKLAEKMAG